MNSIGIRRNKIWYYLDIPHIGFYAKISVGTMNNFKRLLLDCCKEKLEADLWDDKYCPLYRYINKYNVRGYANSIRISDIPKLILKIDIYDNKIHNKMDIAKSLGFKTYCKSVDKIVGRLSLSSIAMLYNELRKEITYGKTSSSSKT